jgi:DNA (cytosine-5)-methyltransferase 1
MTRPLLLDLFCGAGGAAWGYHQAGFRVVGVDIVNQPNYPFEFYQGDALAALRSVNGFAAIHASPPCQAHTTLAKGNNGNVDKYPDLVSATRQALIDTGLPYVIENVPSAPLDNPITLCGEMFGLGVIRHRIFESNVLLMQPEHVPHRGRVAGWRHGKRFDGPYCAVYGDGGGKGSLDEWRSAMGTPWMQTRHEIAESIPPAYSEYVGALLLQAIEVAA